MCVCVSVCGQMPVCPSKQTLHCACECTYRACLSLHILISSSPFFLFAPGPPGESAQGFRSERRSTIEYHEKKLVVKQLGGGGKLDLSQDLKERRKVFFNSSQDIKTAFEKLNHSYSLAQGHIQGA